MVDDQNGTRGFELSSPVRLVTEQRWRDPYLLGLGEPAVKKANIGWMVNYDIPKEMRFTCAAPPHVGEARSPSRFSGQASVESATRGISSVSRRGTAGGERIGGELNIGFDACSGRVE